MSPYKVLILDLWTIWISRSIPYSFSLSPETFKNITSSAVWFEYERGLITEEECYQRLADAFSLKLSDVATACAETRAVAREDTTLPSWLRQLRRDMGDDLAVYAMCNIPEPEFTALRLSCVDCDVLDHIFTSSHVHKRKPDQAFYKHVLRAVRVRPEEAIFVDESPDSVLVAQSIGMKALHYSGTDFRRQISNLLQESVPRAHAFLTRNAKELYSTTNTGHTMKDNFTQLLILEALNDRDLVDLREHSRTWNFFQEKPVLTTEKYPDDFDTTSAAILVLEPKDEALVHSVLDEMLEYSSVDGILHTYYDHVRPRIDPIVCINVLRLFSKYGRASELSRTAQWVRDVLYHRAYLNGTRYYPTAEAFLYFFSRYLETTEETVLRDKPDLIVVLKQCLTERLGTKGDALCIAMRLLAGAYVGIHSPLDLAALRSMQCEDGGWEAGCVYRYGSTGISIGNRGLATALAVGAISKQNALTAPPQKDDAVNGGPVKRLTNGYPNQPREQKHLDGRVNGPDEAAHCSGHLQVNGDAHPLDGHAHLGNGGPVIDGVEVDGH
ncbi:uncharacterized protein LTR77_008296 [Saxophila tyrrhenica]|uniref:HAD-like protein n=1 Tax=Saxophila tyrrhenica TaxID=1690608 RepID=A0AAV9P3C9_9PEZI|nr:hypothetical protein LTR77_008296 [Saxophila tyrrhenica]